MKTLFLIPGFKQSTKDARYIKLKSLFRKAGYRVIEYNRSWNRSTISQHTQDFIAFVKQKNIPKEQMTFLGFSFGAMVALIAAAELHPNQLFLCSLSPYFSEDIKRMPERWKHFIGKNRTADFKKILCSEVCKKIRSKTYLFIGEVEAHKFPTLVRRVTYAHKSITTSTIHHIPNTDHEISQKEYLDAIKTVI